MSDATTRAHPPGAPTPTIAFGTVPVVALYAAIAVALTWPLVARATTHVPVGHDNLYVAWSLEWVGRALASAPGSLFDPGIFHPVGGALAFSDPNVSTAILVAPLRLLGANPATLLDAFVLASFVLTALATRALAGAWGASPAGATFAGAMFAFSPIRLARLDHTQLFALWWMPLAMLGLDRLLRSGDRRGLGLLVFAVVGQAYASIYLAAFTVAALGLQLLLAFALGRVEVRPWRALTSLGLASVATLAAAAPLGLAFVELRRTWAPFRSLAENVRYSAAPASLLAAHPDSLVWGRVLSGFADPVAPWEKYTFPGLVVLALALVAAVREPRSWLVRFGWTLALLATVASLGPVLRFGGEATGLVLPYGLAYELVPPLQALRAPARFALLVALGLALAATPVASRLSRLGWVVALTLALAEARLEPFPTTWLPEARAIDRAIAAVGEGAVVEVPLGTTGAERYELEPPRMIQSLAHGRPIVNGYSGYTPPPYRAVAALLADGPDVETLRFLAAWDVASVVLDRDRLSRARLARWQLLIDDGSLVVIADEGAVGLLGIRVEPRPFDRGNGRIVPTRVEAGREQALPVALDLEAGRPIAVPPDQFGWHEASAVWTREGERVEGWAKVFCPPGFDARIPVHALRVVPPLATGRWRVQLEAPCFTVAGLVEVSP